MTAADSEQRLLLVSAGATLFMAGASVAVGYWTGARSIVFDGMYSVVDAGMTVVAWWVARLIARGNDRRFQFGYWHLEPMLALLNSATLVVACVYGFIDGTGALLSGGSSVAVGAPVGYAGASAILNFSVYAFLSRRGRRLESTLLRLDARSWMIGGILNGGIFLSFGLAGIMELWGWGSMAAGVDPVVLMLLALCLLPLPLVTMVKVGKEILQIAPADIDASVTRIAEATAAKHGFVEHRSHVTRVGRVQFIEIGFVAPSSSLTVSYGDLDAIRREIAEAMGGQGPGHWLTVDFTADSQWI